MPAHRECRRKVATPTSGRAQHAEAGPPNSVSRLHGICFCSWSWHRCLLKTRQFRLPCPIWEVFVCHVLPPLITVLLDQARVSTERTFSESSQVAEAEPRRRLLPTASSKSSKTAPTVLTFASSRVRVYWLRCFRLHFPGVRLWGSQWTRSGNK